MSNGKTVLKFKKHLALFESQSSTVRVLCATLRHCNPDWLSVSDYLSCLTLAEIWRVGKTNSGNCLRSTFSKPGSGWPSFINSKISTFSNAGLRRRRLSKGQSTQNKDEFVYRNISQPKINLQKYFRTENKIAAEGKSTESNDEPRRKCSRTKDQPSQTYDEEQEDCTTNDVRSKEGWTYTECVPRPKINLLKARTKTLQTSCWWWITFPRTARHRAKTTTFNCNWNGCQFLSIGNERVPIQLAQCRFPGLANSQCRNINIFFK